MGKFDDDEDDECCESTNILDLALKYDFANKEEIELYKHLLIALKLLEDDDNFSVTESKINLDNSINFFIKTSILSDLPENIGNLFFNIDLKYKVKCEENYVFMDVENKEFKFTIKKY